jgi:hypothetical protein
MSGLKRLTGDRETKLCVSKTNKDKHYYKIMLINNMHLFKTNRDAKS